MPDIPVAEVCALLREVAASVVLPLFGQLSDSDVAEKAPGELVTVADQEAERLIGDGLRRLLPGSVVVGEEAVAADPDLLAHLNGTGDVWLVDPVDGTANFAAGRRPFAVMVALLRDGDLAASWILDPMAGDLAVAHGAASELNGDEVRLTGATPPLEALRGAAMTRFLPDPLRHTAESHGRRLGALLDGQHCAAREYLDLLTGGQHFALFWQALPWDHAPGVLLVRQAGGVARHFDGTEYHPARDRRGLLVAASDQIWHAVRETLLPE